MYWRTNPILFSGIRNRIVKKWNTDSSVGSIFRNMCTLASGAGIAKVLAILTMPVITRLYLPEHFGVLAIFTALVAMLVPLATLRYTMAIPLPKNNGIALNLVGLCGLSLLATTLIALGIFGLAGPALLEVFSMEPLIPYWWLVPVGITGTGLYEVLSSWAVREKAFKPLAKTKIWQTVLGGTVKIGLGFLGLKPFGLLIGQVFTQTGGVLSLFQCFKKNFKDNYRHIKKKHILFLAKRYVDCPKYRLPSQFLLVLSTKAPLLFFGWQYGAETTGQLGLSLTMIALPMTLFGQTTGQAYYAEIAKIGKKYPEKIYTITRSITKKLAFISILPFLLLFFGGPWLFQVVFGEAWYQSGLFSSILSVYLLTQFVYSPVGNGLFNVFEKQFVVFLINLSRVFLILSVFFIAYVFKMNPYKALTLYSGTLAIQYFLVIYVVFKTIQKSMK